MISPEIDERGNQYWYNSKNQLHREDGPTIIRANGVKEWYLNGKRHRIDGPAYIVSNGHRSWHVNGKCHRIDGPAVIFADGSQRWWINDHRYTSNKDYQRVANLTDEEMTLMILKYGDVK